MASSDVDMKRWLALVVALGAGLSLAAPASTRTVPTRWTEHVRQGGHVVLTFKVSRLVFGRRGWSVNASVTNRSREPLRLRQEVFELRQYKTKLITDETPFEYLSANAPRPAFPRVLAQGKTWAGAFGGRGLPTRGWYVKVAFGLFHPFAQSFDTRWWWVTDHKLRY